MEPDITATIWIDGMTCVNCENRIERKLSETAGIHSVKVSYSKGKAIVAYDPQIITPEQIEEIIEKLDYHIRRPVQGEKTEGKADKTGKTEGKAKESGGKRTGERTKEKKRTDITSLVGTIAIIIILFMLFSRFGGSAIFNKFPVAKEGTGYAMLFVIGLLTSVHCVAMCGGICISQCAANNAAGKNPGSFSQLRPSILYNLGRIISYTILGGIIGALGSVISFSGSMRGIVQIIAGVFMVIMGINMLNLFPWLRKFNPRMPKIFARKINDGKKNRGPFYIGLLNGLMPCGPLQAMQLYALSTGSAFSGALSMFLFSIGTVPLMFIFGAVSSFLNRKFTGKMMTVSAILVVVLGVFMFSNGASLSGITFPAIQSASGSQNTQNNGEANIATIQDGIQTVTSGLTSRSYETITVQKGIPVKWTLQAPTGSINGCNGSIVIPKYNVSTDLKTGDNVIEFTPTDSGAVAFSCWMGMIRSKIYVVDELSAYDGSKVPADAAGGGDEGLPSCCGGGGTANYGGSGIDSSSIDNLLIPEVPTDGVSVAKIKDGVQSVDINYTKDGFSPAIIIMQKDLRTEWNIKGGLSSAGQPTVLFPLYYAKIALQEGDNKISLIPDQDFVFYTQDGKYSGYVKVVEDITEADIEAVKKEVKENNK